VPNFISFSFIGPLHPQARLSSQEPKLLSLDPMCRIELDFLSGACGSSGELRLQELFLATLPGEGKRVSIEDAMQASSLLQSSRLWGMVSPQAQGLLRTGMGMLLAVSSGEAPKLPQGACHFLVKVYNRLPKFATLEVKTKKGTHTLVGIEAVQHSFEKVKAMDKGELTLKELICYVPLLADVFASTMPLYITQTDNNVGI
jgi:hypothetical protein